MILNSVGYLLFSLFMLSFLSICGVFFISHKISSTWIKYLIRIAGTLFVLFLSYGLLAISYFGQYKHFMLPDEFMKNGTLNFIIGDHASTMLSTSLGSTSIVTDDEGTVISETKYKAWGEVRYESTTSPTEYTYTGQYSYVSDFGLHFYNARWYDSSLGRFTSSDSIIPLQSQGVQAWDRYAYVNNNPMRYTDPSGHCIGVITCSLTALGFLPNYQGIANVMFWTETDNAVVAAGISVQSQFFTGIIAGSGRGIAQLTSDEMKDFELEGSAFNPYVAVQGMEERIELALNNCRACVTETDNLIVAALALSSTHFIYQR